MTLRRRKSDVDSWITKSLPSAAKATISFIVFGGLSFLGSWGVDTSKTVAKLQDQMADTQEKYNFLSNWLTQDVSAINKRLEGIQQQLTDINQELRKK